MYASSEQISYNGFEPDRWRDEARSPMHVAQAPDHFIDSELWGPLSTLPADRYRFLEAVTRKRVEPIKIGTLPYAIVEHFGRLVNAYRYWRKAAAAGQREAARANAVYIAGVMGHYVADASQPLHLTIHFNGWAEGTPNPENYTTDRRLHGRYESVYVNAAVDIARVRPKVQRPQRLTNVFNSVKDYLDQGFADLKPLYDLEKAGAFNPDRPHAAGTEFISNQIARASTMLGHLWYTAWLESSEPPPLR
jgi:hypothetical protein